MNVEQEIWDDFSRLSFSSLETKHAYGYAREHLGVSYDDKSSLAHNGLNKKLEYDEDYKINQFLNSIDPENIDWHELEKLYPIRQKIELPKEKVDSNPPAEFRTKKELIGINEILLNEWESKRSRLHSKIPNEKSAQDYLIDLRWDNKPKCPRCGNENIYLLNNSNVNFKCSKCGLKFSERVGTIFQNSPLKLLTWYEAIYLLTEIKTAKLSTHQLAKAIGVTQKTSWGMATKIQSKVKDEFMIRVKHGLFNKEAGCYNT